MPELVLGLDVGSTSVCALLVDLSGRVHGKAKTRLDTLHPAPGRIEQDPRQVWMRVEATIAEALAAAGRKASDLAALGVTAQRSSVIVWERESGEPLAPMVLWGDLRGAPRAAELQAAGHLALPLAAVSKLEAVIDGIEHGRARAAAGELAWGTLDSFLVHRLSAGAIHTTDCSNAWSTCYLDLSTLRDWNEATIEFQGLPLGLFPTLCDTYGQLGHTATSAFGAEVPLGAIVADQQCGMFAHDAWEAGDWKASYGTSATLMVSTGETLTLPPGLTPMLQAAHGGRTLFAAEGMVLSAGALLDWLVQGFGLFTSIEELTHEAASVDDTRGVAIRPALQGLGAPHHDATSRAAIVGLSGASTRAHIAHAALESIAFRMREIAERAATIDGIEVAEALPIDGGLATNDLFLQIQADLLGRPVERHSQLEATALGACIAAAIGSGLATREDLAPLTRSTTCFEPAIDANEAAERFSAWQAAVGTEAAGEEE
ncbi:MAG: glycerol kinase [bacterium]|nr:glycerol kinase [bacterium]